MKAESMASLALLSWYVYNHGRFFLVYIMVSLICSVLFLLFFFAFTQTLKRKNLHTVSSIFYYFLGKS